MAEFTKEKTDSEIIYLQKWFSGKHVLVLIGAVFLLALLIVLNLLVFKQDVPSYLQKSDPVYVRLIRTLMLIGIVFGFYSAFAGFFNKTKVEATRSKIATKYTPFPWIGSGEVASDRITRILMEENQGGKEAATYEIKVETRDGRRKTLLSKVADQEKAEEVIRDITEFMELEEPG